MQHSTPLKQTSLYDEHLKLQGRMVDFGGWSLPVNYQAGVLNEHHFVRSNCGIFDVSHMGEIMVSGPDAKNFMQYLTINDVERIVVGKGQYSAILNFSGGVIDDLIVYQVDTNKYFICVNASNIEKDFNWIAKIAEDFDVQVTNESAKWSQIAVQGPTSKLVLKEILDPEDRGVFERLQYMQIFDSKMFGTEILIARTGYTGELGYEIYMPNEIAREIWPKLLAANLQQLDQPKVMPIGLGARDTLRLEACYLLYGNDMNEDTTPLEVGMDWVVRWNCGEFVGKSALDQQQVEGIRRLNFAFKMIDKGICRHGMEVYKGDKKIGMVGSGSVLPTVGGAGGLAFLDADGLKIGDQIEIDIRGTRKLAQLVKRPLYSAKVK